MNTSLKLLAFFLHCDVLVITQLIVWGHVSSVEGVAQDGLCSNKINVDQKGPDHMQRW